MERDEYNTKDFIMKWLKNLLGCKCLLEIDGSGISSIKNEIKTQEELNRIKSIFRNQKETMQLKATIIHCSNCNIFDCKNIPCLQSVPDKIVKTL